MRKQKNCGFIEKKKLWKNGFVRTFQILLTIFIIIALNVNGFSQEKELKVNKDEQEQVVKKISKILEDNYVTQKLRKR